MGVWLCYTNNALPITVFFQGDLRLKVFHYVLQMIIYLLSFKMQGIQRGPGTAEQREGNLRII